MAPVDQKDQKPAKAEGMLPAVMPAMDHKPQAAPNPLARRTVYNRKTGEAVNGLYAVDAREYVRTGNYSWSPPDIKKTAPEKPKEPKGGKEPEGDGGKESSDDEPAVKTWEDWTVRQLRMAAKKAKVKGAKDKKRGALIRGLEKKGVKPGDA